MKPRKLPDEPIIGTTPSGLSVIAETNHDLTNVVERLGYFYSLHVDRNECDNPLARVLNPEHEGRRVHTDDDVWLLPFRKGYRVLVIKHWRGITGPHAARLYYQSRQTRSLYWLATLQIDDTMFYNEEVIVAKLRAAIVAKEFYIAPHSRKDIVVK